MFRENTDWISKQACGGTTFCVQGAALGGTTVAAGMTQGDCVAYARQAYDWLCEDVQWFDKNRLSEGISTLRKAENDEMARKGARLVMAAVSGAIYD